MSSYTRVIVRISIKIKTIGSLYIFGHYARQRKTTGNALSEHQNVWNYVPMLNSEPLKKRRIRRVLIRGEMPYTFPVLQKPD